MLRTGRIPLLTDLSVAADGLVQQHIMTSACAQ